MSGLVAPLHAAYRRTGADLPYGDPRASHGAPMEGYYWRVTDASGSLALAALCGVNRAPDGRWGTVALAVADEHTPGGGRVVETVAPLAADATRRLRVSAWDRPVADEQRPADARRVFLADERSVHLDLGDAGELHVEVDPRGAWEPSFLHGGGVASVVPFLSQYWHPWLLGGRASGTVVVDGVARRLRDARVYAEKNWGRGFPSEWWWGQAHDFHTDARPRALARVAGEDPDVCVAFAGGVLELGAAHTRITGVVVRIGAAVLRLAPPFARVRSDVRPGRWVVDARTPRTRVRLVGTADPSGLVDLPVPDPVRRVQHPTDRHALRGTLTLEVTRDGRVRYRGASELATLETGTRPCATPATTTGVGEVGTTTAG